jgi:CRP-like cAMP-binding protein
VSQEALIAPLRRVALFEGLSGEQLAAIARCAERIVFKPGDKIIEDGTDVGAAFLVVSGEARLLGSGEGEESETVEPGSLLAEMSMFIDAEPSATVVATSAVRALKLERHAMLDRMTADPTLADHFVAAISGRLKDIALELRRIDRTLAGEHPIDTDWHPVEATDAETRH